MKVKSESEVAQSCLTLSDPKDCSLPGSSVHGIFQARVLEWGAIAFSDLFFQNLSKKKKTPKRFLCIKNLRIFELRKKLMFECIKDYLNKIYFLSCPSENQIILESNIKPITYK